MKFDLIQDGIVLTYEYYGELQERGGMDLGIIICSPETPTIGSWYDCLRASSPVQVAGTLGVLSDFKDTPEINEILNSEICTAFVRKYLDTNYFSEPYFIDGMFGRFSKYGNIPYPDDEEEESLLFQIALDGQNVILKFDEPICFGEWQDKIFINIDEVDSFESELNQVIELFTPSNW
jgi:hypothetical protein